MRNSWPLLGQVMISISLVGKAGKSTASSGSICMSSTTRHTGLGRQWVCFVSSGVTV